MQAGQGKGGGDQNTYAQQLTGGGQQQQTLGMQGLAALMDAFSPAPTRGDVGGSSLSDRLRSMPEAPPPQMPAPQPMPMGQGVMAPAAGAMQMPVEDAAASALKRRMMDIQQLGNMGGFFT